jgi:methyl-accepting chemotaxis protein
MITSINAISDGNREIMEQMQRSNDQISEIVNVIRNIAEKTNVINDIVFQTKLLSFNASVEAARAGDHGKGFSVVAEEVGNLASMSGNAAKEISGMLEDSVIKVSSIVADTRNLMESLMSKSRSKIETGALMASECGRVFDQIHGNVTALNAMVNEIATASREQTSGIEEVNKAVIQLETVTQETATSSQLSSESAAALKTQSETLYSVVNELGDIINGGGPEIAGAEIVSIRSSRRYKAA